MREARLAEAVCAVARAAIHARGAGRVALLDDGGPEAELAARWLTASLGPGSVVRVHDAGPGMDSLLHPASAMEALRLRARLVPDAVPANPVNKTALVLGGALPPERLLPLGDLWASQVQELAGGWSAPPEVMRVAERAGGIQALDAALAAWLEQRDASALDRLPVEAATAVRTRFAAGRADRIHPVVVPKLTPRTVGVDLFE